jgi:DNA-binding SARP family transcriptional activator
VQTAEKIMGRSAETRDSTDGIWSIALLGRFAVWSNGRLLDLPTDSQRLVAFLALQSGRVPRAYVAGTLWLDASQERAFGNLRSALWRLRRETETLIDADSQTLEVNPRAVVDIATVTRSADRLCASATECSEHDVDPTPFTKEFLPGWYDEWTVVHRERLRQRSLHALEAIAEHLTEMGRHSEAIQAALAAIEIDTLRETPHRCLISTHIAEGNYSEAVSHYNQYRDDLRRDLGISPSPRIQALVEQVTL